jgi:hypothetical protein
MIAPNTVGHLPGENDHNLEATNSSTFRGLPFPPLTKQHVLNCAYNVWWPKYRSFVPKSRIIPLTQPFIEYLQADGIYLPTDNEPARPGFDDADDDEDGEEEIDITKDWRPLHEQIQVTIKELGGKVLPKLNWSSPKDATHMLGNAMTCYGADDVYLLLKSSDFISFDLNHAFDDTVDDCNDSSIPWHLVLRKQFNINPSVEFRCFVKNRRLVGVCQRDMNYYDFLHKEQDRFVGLIEDFYEEKLRDTFAEENFVFDVYVPEPHKKVWLIDINPWAQRTDPLLFSWLELLTMEVPADVPTEPVRLQLASTNLTNSTDSSLGGELSKALEVDEEDVSDSDEAEDLFTPEFRLVKRDDPEAYGFASPQYSAHKMPKDVVDAATGGNTSALRELSLEWKDAWERARKDDERGGGEDEDG